MILGIRTIFSGIEVPRNIPWRALAIGNNLKAIV